MDINSTLAKQIYDDEVLIAKSNQSWHNDNYEAYLRILDNVRDDKTYEWQSNIRIPEFVSHTLAQSAIDVGQYFSTRDFVEVKINDPSDQAKNAAESAKELINRTLNKRNLHHYQKFVRGKSICNLMGQVFLKCWWEQEKEVQVTGVEVKRIPLDVDINGEKITEAWQEPAVREVEEEIEEEVATKDCFNYDVYDQRNVFVSDEYAYSLQDKEWIIFRDEVTVGDLEADQEMNQYFDIDLIGNPPTVTDTKEESYQGSGSPEGAIKQNQSKAEGQYDRYERYGKYWAIKTENDFKIGIDADGFVLENATYEEAIITFVTDGTNTTLIGFKKTPFVDSNNKEYKPCIRGICYVHPNDDKGMGDGQNVRELQTAIDDTFNISQDRVMLSTMPTLKVARQSVEDNHSIYIEPMHLIELNDVNDLQEFRVTDNTVGALNQMKYLEDKGRQVDTMNETTTGGVPSIASTTATAVAASSQGSNTRINYKSMSYENTCLIELYWMIQQMTYQFATDKTGFELMGDKLYEFDPSLEYYYAPLSQSIEPEVAKATKRREWTQLMQTIVQIQHPDTVKIVNFILGEVVKLMGDEYESAVTFGEDTPAQTGGQQGQVEGDPTSNQYGIPQSQEEAYTRNA